jgi:predicted component of type VI protein secretion system
MRKIFFLVLLALVFTSCGASKKVEKKPSWIQDKVVVEDNSKISAVGVSSSMGNEGRSWEMAEKDALRKISLVIQVYQDSFQQSFMNVTNTTLQQRIFQMSSSVSSAHLSSLKTLKQWKDSKKDSYYVLVEADLGAIKKGVVKKIEEEVAPEEQKNAIEDLEKRSADAHARLKDKMKDLKWDE